MQKLDPDKANIKLGRFDLLGVLRVLFWLNLAIPFLFCFFSPGLPAEGDALDYRLPLIQWFFRHKAYPNFSWTYVDDFPALGEILMALFSLIGPWAMRLVAVGGYVLFSWAVLQIAKKIFPKTWAYLASILVISSSLITKQDNLLMVDLLASSFFMCACVFFLNYLNGSRRALLWSGLFAGFAFATRYTQVPPVAILSLFVLWAVYQKKDWVRVFPFGLAVLLPVLPWLVRNVVVNGNPLYPLMHGLFGGVNIDQLRASEITQIVSGYGFGTSLFEFIILPFRFAFFPGAFDYSAGPYFLSFLPWIAMNFFMVRYAYQRDKKMRLNQECFIFLGCLAFTFAWFLSSQQTRFWLHGQPLVIFSAILGARAWFAENSKSKPFYRVFFLFLIALAGLGTLKHLHKHKEEVFGKYQLAVQPDVVEWLNRKTAKNAKVVYFERTGNVSSVDRDFLFLYPHPYATREMDQRLFHSSQEFIERVKKEGGEYFYILDLNKFAPELRVLLKLVYQGKQGGYIYALK